MKRWICALSLLPYYAFCQSWYTQEVIPIHVSAYQKKQSPLLGLENLPSLLGFEKTKEIGVAVENKYSIAALSQVKLSISHPVGSGNISLNSSIQGGTVHSHFSGQVNYGLSLNKLSTLGISIGIIQFKLKDDAPELFLQTIAGIAHLINDKTLLAFHYQLNQAIRTTNTKNAIKHDGLTVGIGYQISQPVFIQLEIRKQDQQLQLLPAINWHPYPKIGFWCGLNSSSHFTVGINGYLKNTTTGIAVANHPHLGYSLQLQINKKLHDKN